MDLSGNESIHSASSPYRSPLSSPGNPSSPVYFQEPTSSPTYVADFPVSSPSRDEVNSTSPTKYGKRKPYTFFEPLGDSSSSKRLRTQEDVNDDDTESLEDRVTIQDNSVTNQYEQPQNNNMLLFQHCESNLSENLNDMVPSSSNYYSQSEVDETNHNVDSLHDGFSTQNSCDDMSGQIVFIATDRNHESLQANNLEENNVLAARDDWAQHIAYSDSSSEDNVDFEAESSSESSDLKSSSSSSCGDEHYSSSSSELEQSCDSSDSEQIGSDSDSDGDFVSPSVYNGCSLTVDEAVLELMNLYLQHSMEKTALGDTLKSLLKFLPKSNNMPKSKHSLLKYVSDLCPLSKERVHFYCSICHYYLGEEEMCCTLCGAESRKFYQLSLADQIKNLFENHGLADEIDKYALQREAAANQEGGINDLCDGSVIKNVKTTGPYNLTLIGHTDGLSLSESSNVSIWPLEFVIAELPPHLRYKYVLISGIWIDESKPNMNSYLKPFVEEISLLNTKGVQWVHPKSQVVHQTSVTVPLFIADAPARAQLQNILSHGGKHCCNICEQKMKKLPAEPLQPGVKRKKRRRVFTFEEEAVLRTADRMKSQAKQSRKRQRLEGGELKAIKGVKGRSIVESLPGCDRSTVVFPEYMHALLCLVKHLMTILFTKSGPWNLSNKQDIINEFLENIRVPDFITRIPRSTEYFAKWKANEFRSFLLYYSIIIFSQCMTEEYFQHWMLLVISFYLLLQNSVSDIDIAKSTAMLELFCADFTRLYKADFFTYYVHNLLHLPLIVKRNGPLWSHSAFQFENFNGKLAKFIHGSKHQAKELVNNINLAFGVGILEGRVKKHIISSNTEAIELKNRVSNCSFTKDESALLTATFQEAKRMEYGMIKYFCEVSDSRVALVQKFDVEHLRSFTLHGTGLVVNHIIPIVISNQINIIQLTDIRCKVIRVGDYLCLRPNTYEMKCPTETK
ncbi:hypothetical protein FOCC_FOCC013204 [Frankliniella occidentalis]|nr:hypothetical protein FOCC_FOCC013204 [Frankliniella occidentalis]